MDRVKLVSSKEIEAEGFKRVSPRVFSKDTFRYILCGSCGSWYKINLKVKRINHISAKCIWCERVNHLMIGVN